MNRCVAAFVLVIALALATLPASRPKPPRLRRRQRRLPEHRSAEEGGERRAFDGAGPAAARLPGHARREPEAARFHRALQRLRKQRPRRRRRVSVLFRARRRARRRQLSDPDRRAKSRPAPAKPAQGRVDLHRQHHPAAEGARHEIADRRARRLPRESVPPGRRPLGRWRARPCADANAGRRVRDLFGRRRRGGAGSAVGQRRRSEFRVHAQFSAAADRSLAVAGVRRQGDAPAGEIARLDHRHDAIARLL